CGTPMSTIAMSAVGAERAGMASAVINATRQAGQVFGVAVLGALIYARLPAASGTSRLLTPAQQALFVSDLRHALWVCAAALLAAAVPVAAQPAAPAGAPVKGDRPHGSRSRRHRRDLHARLEGTRLRDAALAAGRRRHLQRPARRAEQRR